MHQEALIEQEMAREQSRCGACLKRCQRVVFAVFRVVPMGHLTLPLNTHTGSRFFLNCFSVAFAVLAICLIGIYAATSATTLGEIVSSQTFWTAYLSNRKLLMKHASIRPVR